MNTHPVRVALILKSEPILLENVAKVCQILELMSDREFKNRRDVNEVLSLKYHILHYIVKDIKKQVRKSDFQFSRNWVMPKAKYRYVLKKEKIQICSFILLH